MYIEYFGGTHSHKGLPVCQMIDTNKMPNGYFKGFRKIIS